MDTSCVCTRIYARHGPAHSRRIHKLSDRAAQAHQQRDPKHHFNKAIRLDLVQRPGITLGTSAGSLHSHRAKSIITPRIFAGRDGTSLGFVGVPADEHVRANALRQHEPPLRMARGPARLCTAACRLHACSQPIHVPPWLARERASWQQTDTDTNTLSPCGCCWANSHE